MRAGATVFLLVGLLGAACAGRSVAPRSAGAAQAGGEVTSNVLRGDYVGSAVCARCHADEAARWFDSPMHHMTRDASDAAVRAPFSGVALRFKDDTVELSERGGARYVHVHSARFGDALYRVTRVIGGHHREDYAGVPVAREGDAAAAGDELVLPVSYLLWSKKYRYKGYSVMSRERPGVAAGPVWNRTCIFCHNTQPYLSTLLGTLIDPALRRRAAYQGEVVDPLLPEQDRWRVVVDDPAAVERDLRDDVARLSGGAAPSSGSVAELAMRDVEVTRASFTAKDLIEVGIGCEACHGGGREHAEHPEVRMSLSPRSAGLRVQGGSGDADAVRAQRINRTCARCHQVLFSRYPYTWEGGRRAANPGGSHINSGEARDFLLSACSKRADCTLCHDPHAPDNGARAARLETREGDAVCTRCHAKYAGDEALREHAHHDPAGPGGRCVACHMPRKNMSLDGRRTRYHRIGSPTDAVKVLDRPLECALCHGDETVGRIAADMERLWGKRLDENLLRDEYGSLEANVVDATLARGKPHEQAVALALLGERKERRAAPAIAEQLVNPYPLVRFYAEGALERIFDETSPLDLYTTDDAIRAQAAAWLARH